MGVLPTCVHMYHMYALWQRISEEVIRFLEVELPIFVSHHVGAGNWSYAISKKKKCS